MFWETMTEMAKKKNLDHIPKQLQPLAVDITTLVLDDRNARTHDDVGIKAIMESFTKFGQDQLLVVQKDGMIVRKGNGRLEAAKRLGWTHIAALIIDEDSESAMARAIADNRTGDLSDWDFANLTDILDELNGSDYGASLGFSQSEMDNLLKQASLAGEEFNVEEYTDRRQSNAESKEIDVDSFEFTHECPKCHFQYNNTAAEVQANSKAVEANRSK